MDPTTQKRIELAWERCKAWITAFDGSPTVTLFVEAPPAALPPALAALASSGEAFRITAIPAGHPGAPQFIPLEAFPAHLVLLQAGKLADLSVNYALRQEAFDLDLRLVIYALPNGWLALELVWWSDQVFSAETDQPAQFAALAGYFLGLQALFSAPGLYVGPEGAEDLDEGAWVEL